MTRAGTFLGDLRTVWWQQDFRRLFTTRLISQAADGVFQAGLAGVVFFSPERAASAQAIAVVLTVAVLPYTVLGPFVGVLLDRWRRRQVLVVANLVRAVIVAGTAGLVAGGVVGAPLYLAVLAVMSVNRFFLAGIGAALPHVVAEGELVAANAVSPTSGAIAAILGAAGASGLRVLAGPGNATDALIVATAAFGYVASATAATRMAADRLGPVAADRLPWAGVRQAVAGVLGGLVGAARHLTRRHTALAALGATVAVRFGYGVATLMTVLMCRNLLTDPAAVDAGFALLSAAFAATGAGFVGAAVLTAWATRRVGPQRWIVVNLLALAAGTAVLAIRIGVPTLLVVAAVTGLATQGGKICVDSLVQADVDDAFRGRVFSLYDVLYNAAFVLAAGAAAALLPVTGYSRALLVVLVAWYLVAAAGYARAAARAGSARPASAGSGPASG
jgi:MFS family permease